MKELGLIAERTTERLRLLTLCSTAANQRRIYDKSVVHRLEDCTSWINRAKEAIVKAHIIAARNTQLSNVPVRHQTPPCACGLHRGTFTVADTLTALSLDALQLGNATGPRRCPETIWQSKWWLPHFFIQKRPPCHSLAFPLCASRLRSLVNES